MLVEVTLCRVGVAGGTVRRIAYSGTLPDCWRNFALIVFAQEPGGFRYAILRRLLVYSFVGGGIALEPAAEFTQTHFIQ